VQAGETFTSIASRHRISVTQLQAANPGVDSRRLKVGQTLTIPSSGR
jgi:LysM repeat protein